MKLLKRSICLIIVTIFISLSCLLSSVSAANNKQDDSDRASKEIQSLKANTKLLNYFYELVPDEDYDGKYFPDYYGGSYIQDDGNLVIMLKDERGKDAVNSIIGNVNYVSCKYSYSELVNTLNYINKRISEIKDDECVRWFGGMALNDKSNLLKVYMHEYTPESIKWFKENVSNKPYLRFMKQVEDPIFEANYSGQGISSNDYDFSAAFRVIRYTSNGPKYGFITCAHGNSLSQTIYGNDGYTAIGTVQLRQFGGNLDTSYVEMSSSSDFSNVIHGSPYTLNNTNDDLYYPVIGSYVWLHGRENLSSSGVVQSTNVSFISNGISFSGLYSASYTSALGDSGGLVCSSAEDYACNPAGVHSGKYNGVPFFTSACKIINHFHFVRY